MTAPAVGIADDAGGETGDALAHRFDRCWSRERASFALMP
jgi:hypothetical protein